MKLTQKFSQYLLQILPIINYTSYKNELSINIPFNKMVPIFFFLKNHTNTQFKVLSDICVVDYINKKKRFEIIYNLLSIRFNSRLKVKILINEFYKNNSCPDPVISCLLFKRAAGSQYYRSKITDQTAHSNR